MKLVINSCFGGFCLSEECCAALSIDKYDCYDVQRDWDTLIEIVENNGSEWASGSYAKLKVVEIPDNATDWEIHDYDGAESVIFVLDGKIHHGC